MLALAIGLSLVQIFNLCLDSLRRDCKLICRLGDIDLPLHRVADAGKQLARLLEVSHLAVRLCGVMGGAQLAQLKLHRVAAVVQQHGKALGSIFFDELVRVLCTGHRQHTDLDADLIKNIHRPLGGCLSRSVRIVRQHHPLGILGNQPCLLLGQRSAQSCHRVVKARLMDGNDVHIPLCQNQTRALGGFGKVEGKQGLALFKDRRIAGV